MRHVASIIVPSRDGLRVNLVPLKSGRQRWSGLAAEAAPRVSQFRPTRSLPPQAPIRSACASVRLCVYAQRPSPRRPSGRGFNRQLASRPPLPIFGTTRQRRPLAEARRLEYACRWRMPPMRQREPGGPSLPASATRRNQAIRNDTRDTRDRGERDGRTG
jgi:hypothetical protein